MAISIDTVVRWRTPIGHVMTGVVIGVFGRGATRDFIVEVLLNGKRTGARTFLAEEKLEVAE